MSIVFPRVNARDQWLFTSDNIRFPTAVFAKAILPKIQRSDSIQYFNQQLSIKWRTNHVKYGEITWKQITCNVKW